MVNNSERKCNIQEPQLSSIAHNYNSISILLQGILLLVTSSFPKKSCILITFSDSSSLIYFRHVGIRNIFDKFISNLINILLQKYLRLINISS
jgi:hypothetical protein